MHTYDINGWYSGCCQSDRDAGRVTDIDPQAVDGGPAPRWSGVAWDLPIPAAEVNLGDE